MAFFRCHKEKKQDYSRLIDLPKLSRAKVYRASEKPEALFYGEASAEGGNPVTMSISF